MTALSYLYFIRHGIAMDPQACATDEERPLTKEGDRKTRKVAQRLRELDLRFDLILTSPLVRARQTAEILQLAGLSSQLQESATLAPEGELSQWLEWYQQWREGGGKTLALVGHQPNLGNWAETFLWGRARDAIVLKKAGAIGLIVPDTGSPVSRSQLFWLTPPKFLLS